MQTAEKITPTFIIKLVILFVLLLAGVFMRPSKLAPAAKTNSVQNLQPILPDNNGYLPTQDLYYKLVKQDNNTPSI